jgi:hypothetical protein
MLRFQEAPFGLTVAPGEFAYAAAGERNIILFAAANTPIVTSSSLDSIHEVGWSSASTRNCRASNSARSLFLSPSVRLDSRSSPA